MKIKLNICVTLISLLLVSPLMGEEEKKNPMGRTELSYAAARGQLDVVKQLVKKGADIRSQSYNGESVLYFAVSSRKIDVVDYLLGQGLSPNVPSSYNYVPLHVAAKQGDVPMVEFLVKKGADLHAKDSQGRTALHMAVMGGQLDMVRYLHEQGVDIEAQDNRQRPAVQLSLDYFRSEELIDYLASNSPRYKNDYELQKLCRRGKLKAVKQLFSESVVDVNNTLDKESYTPLHQATYANVPKLCEFLIKQGADVNKETKSALTPLHLAVGMTRLNVIRILLENGAKATRVVETPGFGRSDHVTPIHYAIALGRPETVRFLIQHGVKPTRSIVAFARRKAGKEKEPKNKFQKSQREIVQLLEESLNQ